MNAQKKVLSKQGKMNDKQNKLHQVKNEISFHCLALEVHSDAIYFSNNCNSDNMSDGFFCLMISAGQGWFSEEAFTVR